MKKNVLVLFGGKSNEHDISLISASNVIDAIDKEKYIVITVFISKEGKWYLFAGNTVDIKNSKFDVSKLDEAILSPDCVNKSLLVFSSSGIKTIKIDVVFPVLHGKNGEDGTVQGLFELAGIPYVGSGVAASSCGMDKSFTKLVFDSENIPQAKYLVFCRGDDYNELLKNVKETIKFPCFIKPARGGSSIGTAKVNDESALFDAINVALAEDQKVLIEEYINCREVEIAVMGNGKEIKLTEVGEIIQEFEYYDFEAKYVKTDNLKLEIPAKISPEQSTLIKDFAKRAYIKLNCKSLARIDFFIDLNTQNIILNEINTMPGFTSISMYPILFCELGMTYSEVVNSLIALAKTENE